MDQSVIEPTYREVGQWRLAWTIAAAAPLLAMIAPLPWSGPADVAVFLIAAVCLVVYAFHRGQMRAERFERSAGGAPQLEDTWHIRLAALGIALLASVVVFAAGRVALYDTYNDFRTLQALACLVPALCVAPCMYALTKKPFAALVFTLTLVACTKMAAGVVNCAVYGWYAAEEGRTRMPWDQPDLMVWVFWLNNLLLAAGCYWLGQRRFLAEKSVPSAAA